MISSDRVHIFDEGAGIYELDVMSDAGHMEYVRAIPVDKLDQLEVDQAWLLASDDMTEFWERVNNIRNRDF